MINVLLTGDNNVLKGMSLCILSIVKRTKAPVHFHIMTIGIDWKRHIEKISEENFNILKNEILKISPESVFSYYDVTEEMEKVFKNTPNQNPVYSPASLIRLFLYKYIDCERLIYLDCDTLVNNSLEEFEEINLDDYEFGVVLDHMGKFWIKKDYFNSGVLYINMPLCKKNKVFENAINLLMKKKYYFADQSALYHSTTKRLYLDRRFNEQRRPNDKTVVKHFCKGIQYLPYFYVYNIKQWNIKKVHSFLKIHEFDDIYELYDKIFESRWPIKEDKK